MGLGGVAIAVLPSVVYPQTVVLGQAGGGDFYRIHFFSYLCIPYQDNSIADTNYALNELALLRIFFTTVFHNRY